MSGHSHWATIKRAKEGEDKKRGKIFSKFARIITIVAKEGGGSLEGNPKLRMAVEQAKAINMPRENIDRAIKKGTGELVGEKLEEETFEAFGPGGIALIIDAITDNKNRTLGDIKQILNKNNGKMANEGSVRWLFEKKGVIVIDLKSQTGDLANKENLEMNAIEAGADDIFWSEDVLEIYVKTENLEIVKKALEGKGAKFESVSLDWVAKDLVEVEPGEKEKAVKLFDELDDNDAVQNVFSNLK